MTTTSAGTAPLSLSKQLHLDAEPGVNPEKAHLDLDDLAARLERIEELLTTLVERQTVREWYTTEQFAQAVGKAEFTVREWCRHGRIRAEKRMSGRGAHPAWVISHAELLRYERGGLLPASQAC
jgi:hypothetical protein